MLTLPLVLVLSLGSPQAQTAPAARPTQIDVKVTDRTGAPIEGARVSAEGPVSREGTTDRTGTVTFKSITAGSFRFRISRDGFLTLEKEATAKAAATTAVDASLNAAPPPPPPPAPVVVAPPPAPAPSALPPGDPRVVSIPDLAEAEPLGRDAIKESAIGCSGASASRLIQTKDTLAAHTHADADEMLYIVAGEGTLRIGGKDYAVSGGWFGVVPRGTDHSLTRKGRTPVIALSVVSGVPCPTKSK